MEKEYRIVYPLSSDLGQSVNISELGLKVDRICAGFNCSEKHKFRLEKICNDLKCGNLLETKIYANSYTLLDEHK